MSTNAFPSERPTGVVCRCGVTFPRADLRAAIEHVLCGWPKKAFVVRPDFGLDKPYVPDDSTFLLPFSEDPHK